MTIKNQCVLLIDPEEWVEIKQKLVREGILIRAFSLSNQIRLALGLSPVVKGRDRGGVRGDDETLALLNELRNAVETSVKFQVTVYAEDWERLKGAFCGEDPRLLEEWNRLPPSNRIRRLLGFPLKRRGRQPREN
jgi:hypothetical protein